jgi:hypothetical protein
MELKVKEVSGPEQKSVQEVETELVEKTAEQEIVEEQVVEDKPTEDVVEEQQPEVEAPQFGEEEVLSFIKDRYKKEINSVDELFTQREADVDLPEDVSAFLKYKKETGRGINDFMKLQEDFDQMNPDQLLRDYYSVTENDLDSEDIEYLMSEKFSYDEDLDEDSEVKAKKIAKKRELAKAKKYFNELKETYKVPIESKVPVNEDELEQYNAYKEYISQSSTIQEENAKKSEYFSKKTEELFNDEFKGFEFKVGEKSLVFKPGEASELKSVQSDITNFVSKYLDDNGMIKDPAGYHKALSAAINPDKLASYFYEKGKADAVDSSVRSSKNIDMDVRSAPQQTVSSSGIKIRAVESDSGRGLKIKKR